MPKVFRSEAPEASLHNVSSAVHPISRHEDTKLHTVPWAASVFHEINTQIQPNFHPHAADIGMYAVLTHGLLPSARPAAGLQYRSVQHRVADDTTPYHHSCACIQ